MKYATASIADTVEILAADEFVGVSITVTGTSVVKAGTPMTHGGVKATEADADGGKAASTNADGVLLYDVDPTENPNGTLVVQGVIDQKKAKANSGCKLDVAAMKAAVPGLILRTNIGVNT